MRRETRERRMRKERELKELEAQRLNQAENALRRRKEKIMESHDKYLKKGARASQKKKVIKAKDILESSQQNDGFTKPLIPSALE